MKLKTSVLPLLLISLWAFSLTVTAQISSGGGGANPFDSGQQPGRTSTGVSASPAAFAGSERPDTGSFAMSENLLSLPGRAGLGINLSLEYDSQLYQLNYNTSNVGYQTNNGWSIDATRGDNYPIVTSLGSYNSVYTYTDALKGMTAYGFTLGYGAVIMPNRDMSCYEYTVPDLTYCGGGRTPPEPQKPPYPGPVFIDKAGVRHAFGVRDISHDGSDLRYRIEADLPTITYPDGTKIIFGHGIAMHTADLKRQEWQCPDNGIARRQCSVYDRIYYATRVIDRNGNYIQINYRQSSPATMWGGPHISSIVDTLGRTIKFNYDSNGWRLLSITAPGFESNTEREGVRFHYEGLARRHTFAVQASYTENVTVLRHVYFPGTRTGLRYSYSSYGMIYKVERLRGMDMDSNGAITGDVVAYTEYNYPTTPDTQLNNVPRYTKRTDWWQGSTVGVVEHNFNLVHDSAARTSTTTITAPDGTISEVKKIWYSPQERSSSVYQPVDWLNFWNDGLVREVKISRDNKQYSLETYDWEKTWTGPRLRERLVSVDGGSQKKVVYQYYNPPSCTSTGLNCNGVHSNVTAIKEYGFDGAELMRTETTYKNYDTDPNYINRWLVKLPTSVKVYANGSDKPISQVDYNYDANPNLTACPGVPMYQDPLTNDRGNLTSTSSNTNAATPAQGVTVTTSMKYDIAGNVVESVDAKNNVSTVTFEDSFSDFQDRHTYAYPTSATSPIPEQTAGEHGAQGSHAAFTTKTVYNFNTGLVTSSTDANSRTTSYEYNDPVNRVTKTNLPDGGWVSYDYSETANDFYVKTQTKQDDSTTLTSYQFFDALGRKARAQNLVGETYTTVDTEYDVMGRVRRVSNAYLAAMNATPNPDTRVWTVTSYDASGRALTVTTPDGAEVKTAYDGTRTLVTDQAGKQRLTQINALGQLADVWEIRSADAATEAVSFPGHPEVAAGYRTSYTYDVLGNMRQVKQGAQRRYFAYDSLSRLIRVRLPELGVNADLALPADLVSPLSTDNNSWSAAYEYDSNGNVREFTDARGIKTKHAYDALNRITTTGYVAPQATPENYSATPPTIYFYDGTGLATTPGDSAGRLTAVTSGGTSQKYTSFDAMGRVQSSQQVIDGQTYTFANYSYDQSGKLKSVTYPSGRVVTTDYDAGGRVAGVQKSAGGYYVGGAPSDSINRIQYAAHGALKAMKLGNGLWEQSDFNARLQLKEVSLGNTAGSSEILKLNYSYGTTNNDGNVRSQTISLPGVPQIVQSYSYDRLNRLESAQETSNEAQQWIQSFKYDPYGNRSVNTEVENNQSKTTPALVGANPLISESNNRIVRRANSTEQYLYDEAGNMVRDQVGNAYSYDANNLQAQYFYPGNLTTPAATYTYDGDGRRVKRVANGVTTLYVYDALGQLAAEYSTGTSSTSGTRYVTLDLLGSPRVITDGAGMVKERHDYLPFGEEIGTHYGGRSDVPGYNTHQLQQKFTGYQRDIETGLDFAQARYYSNSYGRFNSPDPLLTSARANSPQTWNRYAYCGNNPINYTDPSGLDWWFDRTDKNPFPIFFNRDPGGNYRRWAEEGPGYVYYSSISGKWWALNPNSDQALSFSNGLAASRAFFNFIGGSGGGIEMSMGRRDFLAGASTGVSPIGFMFTSLLEANGIDTTSRDFHWGIGAGVIASAGAGMLSEAAQTIRVGRWMSQTEFNAMQTTGLVQESRLGVTNVAYPADSSAFLNQAEVGSLYIEFNVPASSVINKGGGWGLIPGPNSIYARLAERQGGAIPQMPPATKIVHCATKICR